MKRFLVVVLIVAALVLGYFLGISSDQRRPSDLNLRDIRTTTAVRTALSLNKHLDGTGITVDVKDGRVELAGTVRTEDQRRLAEEIAASIEGVAGVNNAITINTAVAGPATDSQTRSLGERLDDITTAARVRAALALHKDIDRGDVSVDLYKGTATLTGTVPTWAARELAAKVAEDVEGVSHVDNQINVKESRIRTEPEGDYPSEQPQGPGGISVPQQFTDSAAQLQIETALRIKPQIDARRVHVEVLNGVAHLTGTVASEAESSLIEKVAEDCWGVSRVINDITYEGAQAAQPQAGQPVSP